MKLAANILIFIAFFTVQLGGKETSVWSPTLTNQELQIRAKDGDSYSQAVLGIFLRAGEGGMKVNFAAARQWSLKAAQADEPLGFYNLGNLALLAGDFKNSNSHYQDAQLRLARKASDGDPIAQFAMGEICFFVIPKNPSRGIAYFKQSAALHYPQAQATLGAIYLKGLPSPLPGQPPLLPKDTRKGIELLVEGARRHSMTSRFNLGMAYYNGEGVPKDKDRSKRWLRLAAEQNFAEAQYSLATLLLELDRNANKHEAARLLQRAANQQHHDAAVDLRKLLSGTSVVAQQPKPTPTTPKKATPEQLRLAKEHRLAGERHYNKNPVKAHGYFKTAAELGDPIAQRYLALLLFHGKGCAQDRKAAGKWLRAAAAQGDKEARNILVTFAHFFRE